MTDPSRDAMLNALLYGLALKTPLSFNGKRITRLKLNALKGRDFRRIKNVDDCGDEIIALSTRLPESLVSTMCAEDKALAVRAINHICRNLFEVVK